MEIIALDIPDVKLIIPKKFGDSRGFFMELYRESLFKEAGITDRFVQDNYSRSTFGTVRGLHYQITQPQAKLVTAMRGRVLDVAVDLRIDSPSFGKHIAIELDEAEPQFLYIPIGFAHGFSVLSESADFMYKCSDYYHPEGERGVFWNDSDLGIDWKVEHPILSAKDLVHKPLRDVPKHDLF